MLSSSLGKKEKEKGAEEKASVSASDHNQEVFHQMMRDSSPEMWGMVFEHLSVSDIGAASQACRFFHRVAHSPLVQNHVRQYTQRDYSEMLPGTGKLGDLNKHFTSPHLTCLTLLSRDAFAVVNGDNIHIIKYILQVTGGCSFEQDKVITNSPRNSAEVVPHNQENLLLARLDKNLLVSAQQETIRIWDWQKGECVNTFQHPSSIYALTVTKDAIIVGDKEKEVTLYSHTGSVVKKFETSQCRIGGDINQIYLTKNDNYLINFKFAYGSWELILLDHEGAKIWETMNNKALSEHIFQLGNYCLQPNNKLLIVGRGISPGGNTIVQLDLDDLSMTALSNLEGPCIRDIFPLGNDKYLLHRNDINYSILSPTLLIVDFKTQNIVSDIDRYSDLAEAMILPNGDVITIEYGMAEFSACQELRFLSFANYKNELSPTQKEQPCPRRRV